MHELKNLFVRIPPLLAALFLPAVALAATPPCTPCAGVHVEDPEAVLAALAAEPRLGGEERLYVAWSVDLDGSADPSLFGRVLERGGTPWLVARFRAPAPILENVAVLERELTDLARLARGAGERAHFQIDWQPSAGNANAKDLAFLIKRAAVAVTGSRADARVLLGPLAPDPALLQTLYGEEIAAYVDGIAFEPADGETLEAAASTLAGLDPGKGVVVDARPWPEDPALTLVEAAAASAHGVGVMLFEKASPDADDLRPLKLLAREFTGDLSPDFSTVPEGARRAFSFVRGEDLSLRVIAEVEPGKPAELVLPDPQLKSPRSIHLESFESDLIFGQRRTASGLVLPFEEPGAVLLVSVERMSAAELAGMEGLEEEVTVEDERQMPVEEIVRLFQAFEDGQRRKLDHYQAENTLHMRFNFGNQSNALEVTFRGDLFYRQGESFDWSWDELYFNGVKWRREKIPEIPLIEPERSAVLPLEISLDKAYRYRLRGTATVGERDCWVVDFAPLVEPEDGEPLSQGTVWIDREIYARVKTRAIQVGLVGEVISNEETVIFAPLDENGEPAPWSAESYFLPVESTGQQLLSILNATTQVERATELTSIRINQPNFDENLEAKYASDVTMVRDTTDGLRYLSKDKESGERVLKEDVDMAQKFLVGGIFYDAGLDFPVPLAGINFLSRDWHGTGLQVNGFFAGPLAIASLAEPQLFGSRWDAGISLFGFFVSGEESLFRNGEEIDAEEIETGANGRLNFFVGRPLGQFWKLDFRYGLRFDSFDTSDNTSEDFILPQDTLTQSVETQLRYQRGGWRVVGEASLNMRSDWEFWGLPGNADFDAEQEDYTLWRVTAGKTWWLKNFRKIGFQVDHLDGSDLDRFSKYDFDFFSQSRVAGYQDGLVTAEEANGLHVFYGLEIGEVFRLQVQGDAVWATDEAAALEDELLAGVSFNGTLLGPWGTLVNFDLGVPVEGPADDFVVFVTFLKLFN